MKHKAHKESTTLHKEKELGLDLSGLRDYLSGLRGFLKENIKIRN